MAVAAVAKQVGAVLKAPKLLLVPMLPAALLKAAKDEVRSIIGTTGAYLYLRVLDWSS